MIVYTKKYRLIRGVPWLKHHVDVKLFSINNVWSFIMALNLEPVYKEIFEKFKTRKKFAIRSLEKNMLTVEQDEEICGQKEPRTFEFKSPREFEEFVRVENQFEVDIVNQLQGNKMPYR